MSIGNRTYFASKPSSSYKSNRSCEHLNERHYLFVVFLGIDKDSRSLVLPQKFFTTTMRDTFTRTMVTERRKNHQCWTSLFPPYSLPPSCISFSLSENKQRVLLFYLVKSSFPEKVLQIPLFYVLFHLSRSSEVKGGVSINNLRTSFFLRTSWRES